MNKKLKRELIEWGVLLTVVGVLLVTGWYKEVAGFLQRGLLETGLLKPDISETHRTADYNFLLINQDGETINFSEFENEVVFINVWATWCPPCIAEMPDIHDLFQKVGQDVKFVMISLDEEPSTALNFVERKEFSFPIYFPRNGLPSGFQSSSIPSTYVLSPEGNIVVEEYGLRKYDTKKFRAFLLSLRKE
jgi:thiol-disulfide isomerase/thioredoxin